MEILKKLTNGRFIVNYDSSLKDDFIRINKAWILDMFTLEKEDTKLFDNLDSLVLDGGKIFYLLNCSKQVLSTALLMKVNDTTFELCKFGSDLTIEHKNAGNELLSFILEYCKDNKIKKLTLVTNKKCVAGIHLYNKYGFIKKDIPEEYMNFSRGDIYMEINF